MSLDLLIWVTQKKGVASGKDHKRQGPWIFISEDRQLGNDCEVTARLAAGAGVRVEVVVQDCYGNLCL